jgi:hypothetical protein
MSGTRGAGTDASKYTFVTWMFIIIFSYWRYEFYLKKLCCHVVIFMHIAMNKQLEDTKGVIRSRTWENNLSILIRSVSCSQYCMWLWIVHWLSIRFSRKLLYLGDTLSDTGGKGRVCLIDTLIWKVTHCKETIVPRKLIKQLLQDHHTLIN